MTDNNIEKEKLLEKLQNDVDEASWELLDQHHERGALFVIDNDLELPAVGFTMARDEVEYIRQWLADNKIYRPEEESIAIWKEQETKFNYLIVQPYVLVQVKKDELL